MKTTNRRDGDCNTEIKKSTPSLYLVSCLIWLLPLQLLAQETTIKLDPFTKLSVSNSAKVKLVPGDTYSISFEGTVKDEEKIKDMVDGNELEIRGSEMTRITVTFRKLEEIEIKGMATVKCTEPIQADEFRIDISGSGEVTLNLNAKKTDVDISGAGSLTITGSSETLDMDISGAGNVTADDFKVKVCTADISGSGHCSLNVTDELNTNISGSGAITYQNPPAKINKDISGMGHIGDEYIKGDNDDTTRLSFGDRKVLIIGSNDPDKKSKKDKVKPHWAGFEMGLNGYMTTDQKMYPAGYDFLQLNPSKSVAVNINLVDHGIKLYKRHLMLVTGFGFGWNNYMFKHNDVVLANGGEGIYGVAADSLHFSKNKLNVCYMTSPLLLEYNTSQYEKNSFHISAGAVFGYKIGSHTKQVYEDDGKKVKPKTYSEFSINPWRVDLTARIGYRFLNVFANYDLVSLFRDNKGPELHPYTIGISLVDW